MVTDFPQWLQQFLGCFSQFDPRPGNFPFRRAGNPNDLTGLLINRYGDSFDVSRENVLRHKRQVQPGDHRKKLTPQTIDALNQELNTILTQFEFEND